MIPPRFSFRFSAFRRQAGMALVVTLALTVLITAAVMAFFARATANRALESTRANQSLTHQLGRTASDYVTAGFLGEILTNSVSFGKNGTAADTNAPFVYQPTTNAFSVPQRPLPAAAFSGTNFANLVRRSVNESTNGVGETLASSHSTASASRNGRMLGITFWNAPGLLAGGGFSDTNQVPNWIYLERDGTVTNAPSTNAIGRFAYTVYDIGGLLDANAAGFPGSPSTPEMETLKGTPAGAKLSAANATQDMVTWRNPTTATLGYVAAVTNAATNGFLKTSPGDRRIATRQDLIRLAKNGTNGLSTNSLPLMTHFSRSLTTPGWGPLANASSSYPSYQYKTAANVAGSINRFLPNVRVQSAFTRTDGSSAAVGDSLLNRRFALSRLALLADPSANASRIGTFFGLENYSAATRTWTYPGASIMTLDQVAAAGRDPNFFEILKAVILGGSLARSGGDTAILSGFADGMLDPQILQIGANIIDQYDGDSFPTTIAFNGRNLVGVENLPGILGAVDVIFRRNGPNRQAPEIGGWIQPVIWNPHKNAKALGSGQIRVVAAGNTITFAALEDKTPVPGTQRELTEANSALVLSSLGSFSTPTVINSNTQILTASTPAENQVADVDVSWLTPIQFVGIFAGTVNATESTPPKPLHATGTPLTYHYASIRKGAGGLTLAAQVWDGANWITYNELRNWTGYNESNDIRSTGSGHYHFRCPNSYGRHYARVDPRTARFGLQAGGQDLVGGGGYIGVIPTPDWNHPQFPSTPRPGVIGGFYNGVSGSAYPPTGTGWVGTGGDFQMGTLADNIAGSPPTEGTRSGRYYDDRDGVRRPGEGAYMATSGAASATDGYKTDVADNLPVFLDRPFRSVAELGYVFRDLPWKNLDFFTAQSADAGLLDVFSLVEEPEIAGGRVDLNTLQAPVLQALIEEAERNTSGTSLHILPSEAANIAAAIVAERTANGPFQNIADFVVRFMGNPALTDKIKTRREAVVRALSGGVQTRTWNLLADIVVQTGRFAQGTDAKDFTVEGERRIWASLAIDRPTARIIARQTELPTDE
jgi:hypothetical protein